MKKIILIMASFILTNTAWALNDGFNFTECSGSGTFEQQIQHFNNDYEAAITVGSIPEGIEGLSITLSSNEDVDIRLYGHSNDKIVHWPYGLLSGATEQSTPYLGVEVTYSGYNGFGGKLGHEYITVSGTTQTTMTMKAFGYKAGYAVVDYSWTGKEGCDNSGDGNFTQSIAQDALTLVGEIPAGIPNVTIELTSEKDLDIQLYGEDGTVIVGWKPIGLLSGSRVGSITYNGMHIEWSGYNGTHDNTGHEYIKISGYTTEVLTMKVYGYEAGFANVTYSWNEDADTMHPTPTPTPQPCPEIYEPVCGEYMPTAEQETFGNMCKLTNASEVAFLHEGECDITEPPTPTVTPTPQPCPEIYEPVCGDIHHGEDDMGLPIITTETYPNMCYLDKAGAIYLKDGECNATVTPQVCSEVYEPVCGEDIMTLEQETFQNICKLETSAGGVFLHDGACGVSPTPTPTPTPPPLPENKFLYSGNILDNIFLSSSNNIAILSTKPTNTLNIIDINGSTISTLSLAHVPSKMALSQDGSKLAISSDARVMLVDISDITNLQLLHTYTVPASLGEIVMHDNYIYAIENSGQWADLYSINIDDGNSTKTVYSSFGYASYGKNQKIIINHIQQSLYIMDSGLSPQDINKFDISNGTAVGLYDSPYHGDYNFCNNMWVLSTDKIVTACAVTLNMSNTEELDMIYDGKFNSPNLLYNSYGTPETMIKSISLNGFEDKIIVGIGDKTFGYDTYDTNPHENIIEIHTPTELQLEEQIIVSKQYNEGTDEYRLFIEDAYLVSDDKIIILYRAVLNNSSTHDIANDKFIFEVILI